MLFNSLPFAVFFIIITCLYFLLPHKLRWLLLLFASCFFYMFFKPIYILILGFTIVIDYYAGILLENQQDPKKKKKYLIMSLVANIGVLAIFKYYNFLNTNITGVALLFGYKNPIPFLNILLPIGLSFHTFQAMSYTIEVYRGHQKAERHFGIYALYVMFYPQLVAGPIERPQNMLHQFHDKKYFNATNAVTGLRLMLWGMFKKAVIADRLSNITDPIFNAPHNYSAISIFLAAILFSFQIFCDFSGYSDIAIGSARIMGFKLMQNFDRPYHSKNISEFWRRWHISLSTWFKDYLYIPLGGNRVPKLKRYYNLLIVFLVSGLWHGANWTFILWGALHGVYQVFGMAIKPIKEKCLAALGNKQLFNFLQKATTFLFVTIAWIFFRANTVGDGVFMLYKIPAMFGEIVQMIKKKSMAIDLPVTMYELYFGFFVIGIMEFIHHIQNTKSINNILQQQPRYLRWGIYYAFVMMVIYLGVFQNKQFIYFQF